MRLIVISLIIFLLGGCAMFRQPVPVVPKFPEAMPELLKKCEELKTIEGDKIPITDLLKTVVYNYTLYYQCSAKVDGWQNWYELQKNIHNSIKP